MKHQRLVRLRPSLVTLVLASLAVVVLSAAPVLLEDLTGRQVFPTTNWWNLDVSSAPLDPQSAAYIDWISNRTPSNPTATRRLHPDFGPPPYGIPYVVVDGSQPRVPVTFEYDDESDTGIPGLAGYPIPDEARTMPNYIEGGVPGGGGSGDRHLLMIDRDRWLLYELFATRWNAAAGRWDAGSGAIFNLATNERRPETWTSADAAGLAIFPGLVRYDEVSTGWRDHARVPVLDARDQRLRVAGLASRGIDVRRAAARHAAAHARVARHLGLSGGHSADLPRLQTPRSDPG